MPNSKFKLPVIFDARTNYSTRTVFFQAKTATVSFLAQLDSVIFCL